MTNQVLIQLIFVFAFMSAFHCKSHKPGTKVQKSGYKPYDSYAFAIEWSGSVCNFKDCVDDKSAPGVFNIHGLWPDKNDGHHPFYCTKTKLAFSSLSSQIKKDLGLYWSGLYSSQEEFLNHEWGKHGTCWDPSQGDLNKMPIAVKNLVSSSRSHSQISTDFLELVITLSKSVFNVYQVLAAHGIKPSKAQKYSLSQIESALTSTYGVQHIGVNCLRDESGNSWFSDVMLCIDKNYRPIDCTSKKPSNCSAQDITYPVKESNTGKAALTQIRLF